MAPLLKITYVTGNPHKRQEAETFRLEGQVAIKTMTTAVKDIAVFEFSNVPTHEPLERDLKTMVRHKAKSAYSQLLVPCIVEHAGLIFSEHKSENYPGGLTQPMWDALGPEKFLTEATAKGRKAIARAVIGYCDGAQVLVFSGETEGIIADRPRGNRQFYWDTIFCPDGGCGLTYAELCDDPSQGMSKKFNCHSRLRQ